jgi:membrane fusion protein, gold/copper resistance efflux system
MLKRISRRADALLKSHTISQEEADGRRSDLAEAVAALKSAEAARDSAQLDYEQSAVRSPISGRISRATDGKLTPGLFARVRIPASAQHCALLISETAIGTDQGQKYVLVVDKDDTAQYRKVTLGGHVEGKRVVTEGISPADQIIVDGQARVQPGMKVLTQTATRSATIPQKQKES